MLLAGGYESYTHSTKATLSYMAPVYAQGNRGGITRSVSAKGDGTDAALWTYSQNNSSCPGTVCMTVPDGTLIARYLYGDSNASFGYSYDGARAGMPYEERVYSASGQMLHRKLTEWTETGTNAVNQYAQQATRNARVTKEVEILLDTGGGLALAKTTTYGYDTTYQFDVGTEQTSSSEYGYASVDQNTAQTGAITSIPTGTLLRTTQTSYLTSNSSYRLRNILGLPTSVVVQNASGTPVAQTAMSYDEPTYQLGNTYGTVTGWSDPGAVRGNLTTTSHWLDTTNTWIPTHAQYDQCGCVVGSLDANGNQTQASYSSTYAYAYPTGTTSAVPDPTPQTRAIHAGQTRR